jgi:hypothetical protein
VIVLLSLGYVYRVFRNEHTLKGPMRLAAYVTVFAVYMALFALFTILGRWIQQHFRPGVYSMLGGPAEPFCAGGGSSRQGWGKPAGAWPGAYSYGGDTGGSTLGWLPLASLVPPQESSDCTLTGCPRGQACWTDAAGVSRCVGALTA